MQGLALPHKASRLPACYQLRTLSLRMYRATGFLRSCSPLRGMPSAVGRGKVMVTMLVFLALANLPSPWGQGWDWDSLSCFRRSSSCSVYSEAGWVSACLLSLGK